MNDCIRELRDNKRKRNNLIFWQILIIVLFFGLWELLTHFDIIDSFLISSPSKKLTA